MARVHLHLESLMTILCALTFCLMYLILKTTVLKGDPMSNCQLPPGEDKSDTDMPQRVKDANAFTDALVRDKGDGNIPNVKAGELDGIEHVTESPKVKHKHRVVDTLLTGPANISAAFREYVKLRPRRTNDHSDFNFLISGDNICSGERPVFLVILCVSGFYETEKRRMIRETWGSVAKTERWADGKHVHQVKLAFLLANPGPSIDGPELAKINANLDVVKRAMVKEESDDFGDIVLADIEECLQSESKRMMAGLSWINTFCERTKFVLRVGEDSMVHVPNLVTYLRPFKVQKRGLLIGSVLPSSKVLRGGKFAVNQSLYPFDLYPPHLSGAAYVISGNVVKAMLTAAEQLPYIFIEDVFITGLAREAIGAEIKHRKEFARATARAPEVCALHETGRISVTNVKAALQLEMWEALRWRRTRSYSILAVQLLCFVSLTVTCFVLFSRESKIGEISVHSECQLMISDTRLNQLNIDGNSLENRLADSESRLIMDTSKQDGQAVDSVNYNDDNTEDIENPEHGDNADTLRLADDRTLFDSDEFQTYIRPRDTRVNPHDYNFLLTGRDICSGEAPTLMIMVLSEYFHVEERLAIRNTYGSVVRTQVWPRMDTKLNVKIAFVFGGPQGSLAKYTIAAEEDKQFGDIVMVDFKDSYENLTSKVLMSIKWTTLYCPDAKFMLKIDEDTFVHLGNLVTFLHTLVVPDSGVIIGHGVYRSGVLRTGRWSVSNSTYPFDEYPPYASGNTYVISGNVLSRLFSAAEFLPYVTIEDAFLTGIVREAVGAELRHKVGFTWWEERPPRLCGFHNDVRISGTNCDVELMRGIWRALAVTNMKNCYDPTRFEKPVYV